MKMAESPKLPLPIFHGSIKIISVLQTQDGTPGDSQAGRPVALLRRWP
jgi:hypothetical protein